MKYVVPIPTTALQLCLCHWNSNGNGIPICIPTSVTPLMAASRYFMYVILIVCITETDDNLYCAFTLREVILTYWCASSSMVECRICNQEAAGSNLSLGYFAPRSAQPSIPSGSVNEYQLRLGRQRQVWLIPIADERVGVQVNREILWEHVPYLSASAVVIHYEEALYQVYASLPLCTLTLEW